MSLDYVVDLVMRLKPGCSVPVADLHMRAVRLTKVDGVQFTAADVVLDNIPGAPVEFYYRYNEKTRFATFYRLTAPLTDGRLTYVPPHERALYYRSISGFYKLLEKEKNNGDKDITR